MGLRLATNADLSAGVQIGEEFWNACEYKTPYNAGGVLGFLTGLVQQRQFLVYEFEGEIVGVAGLLITPFHFDPTMIVATEVFWYVRPGVRTHGVGEAMLEGMEALAKARGAVMFSMGTMYDPKADVLLTKNGYKVTEKTYTKVL
jgi:GNAT superfamily N-acetyltransferase